MTVGYLDPADNVVKQVMTADDVVDALAPLQTAIEALTSTATPAPVYATGQKYKACPVNAATALSASPAVGDRLDILTIMPTDTSPASTVTVKDGTTVIWTWAGGTLATNQPQQFLFNIAATAAAGFTVTCPSDVSALATGSWA